MKKGFTLAEVLITLAVIGIVAAITIPVVVTNYQKKAQYTQFMKAYNTLQTAINLSTADNGDISSWSYGSNDNERAAAFKKYLGNYLKVAQDCTDDPSACGVSNQVPINALNSDSLQGATYADIIGSDGYVTNVYLLQDGSLVIPWGGERIDAIYIDTNGTKGPNTFGRDFFAFMNVTVGDKDSFAPAGMYDWDGEGYAANTLEDIKTSSNDDINCSTTVESIGVGCAARLLLEGKMDY